MMNSRLWNLYGPGGYAGLLSGIAKAFLRTSASFMTDPSDVESGDRRAISYPAARARSNANTLLRRSDDGAAVRRRGAVRERHSIAEIDCPVSA